MKNYFTTICVLTILILIIGFTQVQADDSNSRSGSIIVEHRPTDYPGLAKITPQKALDIVSKQTSGGILEMELDEVGGYLVYEVEVIVKEDHIKEYLIDAGTGNILGIIEEEEEDEKDSDEEGEEDEDELNKPGSIKVEYEDHELPAMAKISILKAIKIATDQANGAFLAFALDEDDGYLVYEVLMVTPDKSIMEFDIDAGTGKILEMEEMECSEEDD